MYIPYPKERIITWKTENVIPTWAIGLRGFWKLRGGTVVLDKGHG